MYVSNSFPHEKGSAGSRSKPTLKELFPETYPNPSFVSVHTLCSLVRYRPSSLKMTVSTSAERSRESSSFFSSSISLS